MTAATEALLHQADVTFMDDVHQVWRSSLQPGEDTPFEPHYVEYEVDDGTRTVDAANTAPQELPDSLRQTSFVTGVIAMRMLDGYLRMDPPELGSERIEKMAINLAAFWDPARLYGQRYDLDAVMSIPGVSYYGRKGLDILEAVNQGRPVPIGSEADDLSGH
jgi:hypothetical protein